MYIVHIVQDAFDAIKYAQTKMQTPFKSILLAKMQMSNYLHHIGFHSKWEFSSCNIGSNNVEIISKWTRNLR